MRLGVVVVSQLLVVWGALTASTQESQKQTNNCSDSAQTQSALNQCAGSSAQKADNELNRVYGEILRKYGRDKIFIEKLKRSQRAWIKFRDAQIEVKFPPREPGWYGSVLPMCRAYYTAELTLARVQQLKEWERGIPEGDVCIGSVKTAEAIKLDRENPGHNNQ